MELLYLDYNATTPVDPAVADAMLPFMQSRFGNPSSIHEYGTLAKMAVEEARSQVARLLNCFPDEIIFTSGGTESNNHAIKGTAFALRQWGNHIITSVTEHPSVIEVCRFLEQNGFRVTWLPVDETGRVNPGLLEKSITPATILITVMHANNETGTIQPVEEIGAIAARHGIVFHTDAAQSTGKIPVDVRAMNASLLSVAGHKLYAPKGIGVLYIRRGITLEKMMHGADHEQNLRAGTENVISIVGLGKACEIGSMKYEERTVNFKWLRDMLENGILAEIPEAKVNGHRELRLPNTLNISFPGVDVNLLLARMTGIAASAGAACHSASEVISPVLKAMGVPDHYAMGTVRFSLGRMTSEQEILTALPIITDAVKALSKTDMPSSILQSPSSIKLTQYTHSLGCACKIRPQLLESILSGIPLPTDPDVLVGIATHDDAAVYRINDETAIVQTVDFIPPVVDDPYQYGAIAAANALSDVYAMGGKPLFALSVVAFPEKLLPAEVLQQILKGATDKVTEAGISIIGGHTIEDTEPKFGLVVTGTVHPGKYLTNSGACTGDVLILTKPVGGGILSTGMKRGMVNDAGQEQLIRMMSQLNNIAADVMASFPVHACTDVTGFGLLGHLKEMVAGSGLSAGVRVKDVPVLADAWKLVTAGIIPGGTLNNMKYVEDIVVWGDSVPHPARVILCDAQTSGGLLIALPESHGEKLLRALKEAGLGNSSLIGSFTGPGKNIVVTE